MLPGVHKIDVDQGNVIDQAMVDQLKPGMSPAQVRYVMGSPMLTSALHADRWDYLYRRQPGGEAAVQERVTLYFDQNRLIRVEGDYRPHTTDPLDTTANVSVVVPPKPRKSWDAYERLLDNIGLGRN